MTAATAPRRPGNAPEVIMCNFELSPEQFRQRREEMIALAEERRLVRAMRPARAPRARARRKAWIRTGSPVRLNPSPLLR